MWSNLRIPGILLIYCVLLFAILSISPSADGCVKKVATVLQNFPRSTANNTGSDGTSDKLNLTVGSTTESPAELANDESVYTKYSHQTKDTGGSRFYLEVEESLDHSVKVYKMDKLPVMYSQIMDNNSRHSSDSLVNNIQSDDSNIQIIDVTGGTTTTTTTTEPTTTTVEPTLDPQDEMVRKDWEGECDHSRWSYCNQLKSITVMNVYNKTEGKEIKWVHLDMDCISMKQLCLRNKWTANKCHLICMSKCNRDILLGWEKFVSYERACKYV